MRSILVVLMLIAGPVRAEEWSLAGAGTVFEPVTDRAAFVDKVGGTTLTRFGIGLRVADDGSITGSAFGLPVRGAWSWQDGHFCRSLAWGGNDLGDNCQAVHVAGGLMRFTSDRGAGRLADFRIE